MKRVDVFETAAICLILIASIPVIEASPRVDPVLVSVDIKPGACPNPFNIKSGGVLPVAVLGTRELDVGEIDEETLTLGRDGVEQTVSPLKSSISDVGTPLNGEFCDCRDLNGDDLNGDGFEDLLLKFDSEQVAEVLSLREVLGQTIALSLQGILGRGREATEFSGSDCMRVFGKSTEAETTFAVYALESVVLRKGARITGGDVAALGEGTGPDRRLEPTVAIYGAKVFGDVYGDTVLLDENARVEDVYANHLNEERAHYRNLFPLDTVLPRPPVFPSISPETGHLLVPAETRMVLAGNPSQVEVGEGATLVLKGGEYKIETLLMGVGSRLEVEGPSRLMISGKLEANSKTFIGPVTGPRQLNLHIVVRSTDVNGVPRVTFGRQSEVNAVISAPNGSLRVDDSVKATGFLLAKRIDIGPGSSVEHYRDLTSVYDPCGTPYCSKIQIEGMGVEWSCVLNEPFPEGTPCNDGNACTEPDECNGLGTCLAGPSVADPDPDNDLPCKRDECDPILGVNEPAGTLCDSNVQCHDPTTCDDFGNCSVIGAELPQGTVCDDGIPNNGNDTCYLNGWCEGEFGQYNCLANNCGTPPNIECWLNEHPNVKYAVQWILAPAASVLSYDNWETWRKQELQQAFVDAWTWHQNGMTNFQGTSLPEPLTNYEPLLDNDLPVTVLDETEAWPFYLAHVAHMLMVEIKALVPWSLCDYYAEHSQMAELFQANYLYSLPLFITYPGYAVRGNVTPAHPTITFSFMANNGLIGTSRLETIANVLNWARGMTHFLGPFTTLNMQYHWQYRGQPPVSRVIDGTIVDPIVGPYPNPRHWTKGCGGTSNFIKEVLRAVNIPVSVLSIQQACPHAAPYFPSEGRYLSHGDDPYTSFWKASTNNSLIPPMEEFLLDQSTYTAWFGGDSGTACNNIGRGPFDVMIDYPPDPLVQMYCNDESQQLSHADGSVYAHGFDIWYSVQELEAAGFWTNLAQTAVALGYCGN